MIRSIRYFFLMLITVSLSVNAQEKNDLEQALSGLLNTAGKAYVKPVASAFGANMNSGWVHRTPQAKLFGVDIELGVVVMGTMFQDENKSFSETAEFVFSKEQATALVETNPNLKNPTAGSPAAIAKSQLITQITGKTYVTSIAGPTVLGKKDDQITVQFPGETYNGFAIAPQTAYTGINGVLDGISALPMVTPQLTIGTIYGTMASVRYLPEVEVENMGKLKYTGFGVQHNPSAWLPIPIPVDLSVAFFTQKLDVGEIFKSSATSFGIYASKKFGFSMLNVTPYAGFTLESSSIDVTYDFEVTTPTGTSKKQITFNLEGENSTRLTLGASFKVLLVSLNVDYSLAKYNVASAGLSFNF